MSCINQNHTVSWALVEYCWSYFHKCYIILDITIFNNSFSAKEIMNVRSYCAKYYLLSDTKTNHYLSKYFLKVFWFCVVFFHSYFLGKFDLKIWSSWNWLKFGTEVDCYMLIFIFSEVLSLYNFGQIWKFHNNLSKFHSILFSSYWRNNIYFYAKLE